VVAEARLESTGEGYGEETQEDFLVLAGECPLLVEGDERWLGPWDVVHCPPWTEHVLIGAGDHPCLLLAVGTRRKGKSLRYPVEEVAIRHGAGVEEETSDPRVAYARFSDDRQVPCPSQFPG
jgi:uncharacterized cupin superfamily protein